ncbi:hypothetical protein GOZ90_24495 [Agrobacterium vitis]|uniref:Uncharacterized protein n=1 Tax=Agrobacterium vitis TaxID=373 RepID=A0A6L6VJ26_AGRVI|nr:hypothetical protein [Agrobacterium vitis]MUZ75830.1 hypothetical protein [Agrobacterium vitis]MVA22742.1 hypothetical protein [Agrobacterium vitis]
MSENYLVSSQGSSFPSTGFNDACLKPSTILIESQPETQKLCRQLARWLGLSPARVDRIALGTCWNGAAIRQADWPCLPIIGYGPKYFIIVQMPDGFVAAFDGNGTIKAKRSMSQELGDIQGRYQRQRQSLVLKMAYSLYIVTRNATVSPQHVVTVALSELAGIICRIELIGQALIAANIEQSTVYDLLSESCHEVLNWALVWDLVCEDDLLALRTLQRGSGTPWAISTRQI